MTGDVTVITLMLFVSGSCRLLVPTKRARLFLSFQYRIDVEILTKLYLLSRVYHNRRIYLNLQIIIWTTNVIANSKVK